jgi:hypothetical protein
MERLKERLDVARRALASLKELAALEQPSRIERDAAIQRFEYTCEALWKALLSAISPWWKVSTLALPKGASVRGVPRCRTAD